jgi:hypothetical protein
MRGDKKREPPDPKFQVVHGGGYMQCPNGHNSVVQYAGRDAGGLYLQVECRECPAKQTIRKPENIHYQGTL